MYAILKEDIMGYTYVKHSCEVIRNLDQCFRSKCCLKVFLI